jgi:hypothetical protein
MRMLEKRHLSTFEKAPPHPRPLSLEGRGEEGKDEAPLWKESAARPEFLLPSPLEGEGLGVRGFFEVDTKKVAFPAGVCRLPKRDRDILDAM